MSHHPWDGLGNHKSTHTPINQLVTIIIIVFRINQLYLMNKWIFPWFQGASPQKY